jgi:DNA-binding ferritin-like protein
MQKDNGAVIALGVVAALSAGAAWQRRSGSRSIKGASKAVKAGLMVAPAVAGLMVAPTPGARVAAAVMLLAPMAVAFGSGAVEDYLSRDRDGQVKMIRSWARLASAGTGPLAPVGWVITWKVLKDTTRAHAVAEQIELFLRQHGDASIEVAAELAEAAGEAVVASAAVKQSQGLKGKSGKRARRRAKLNADSAASSLRTKAAQRGAQMAIRAGSSNRPVIRSVNGRETGSVALLQDLLAKLRVLRWHYHTTHWRVRGESFYGDHLLFERLYAGDTPSVDDQIDALAEKMVAYYGRDVVSSQAVWPEATAFMQSSLQSSDCPYKQALVMENEVQKSIQKAYSAMKEDGSMTLGMDDFLMALANERETPIYLLQQRMDR